MGKTRTLALALLAAITPLWPAGAEVPKVMASIQPIHSLVAAVMQGVGTPGLVVTGTQSEHTYALKPSDARALAAARVVVLVDENYETFLAKPLKGRDKLDVIALADLPGAHVLPTRKGGIWESDEDHHAHEAGGHDGHHHGAMDGHLWLDPANARLLVAAVADRLGELDPEHAETYQANADTTILKLSGLDMQVQAKLYPVMDKPFVVFHDAYQYFERRYNLSAAGSITVDPDRPPSVKRMAALRDRLKSLGSACVFREPQFPLRWSIPWRNRPARARACSIPRAPTSPPVRTTISS
ncbi:MAG: zinc ABC transporter substrate-binding protein [Magnetospirillum sp.]|nr:zinc ABC transporter substrate-binding protein [Magnetospirillum sp.]